MTDSDVKYRVSKAGYEEIPDRGISPLRDLNGECVFINHKFLFHFFSFRNSQFINLFPVFIKDILPFTLSSNRREFISQIYKEVNDGIWRKGRSNQIAEDYIKRINLFNKETKNIIDSINKPELNPNTASAIYNKYFRSYEDPELRITLEYEDHNHNIPKPNVSYWLRLGRRYQKVLKAGVWTEQPMSSRLEVLDPVICMKVEKRLDDGSYQTINKPQSYFNEAKLTAIALSIRFSLVDTVNPIDGGFMALDDMLISLDMSNREKVLRYLLDQLTKYRIYIFTHDWNFFDYLKTTISDRYERIPKNVNDEWAFYELYNTTQISSNPICKISGDAIANAYHHYSTYDYPASANYLRKALEEIIHLYPRDVNKSDDGINKEKLRNKIDAAISLLKRTDADISFLQQARYMLKILLNPLSHRSIDTSIYRNDLRTVFNLLPIIKRQVLELKFQEIIPVVQLVEFHLTENEDTSCIIQINVVEPMYSYIDQSGNRVFSSTQGESESSITIVKGVAGEKKSHQYNKGTLEEICKQLYAHIKKDYKGNYLDHYIYKGKKLTEYL